MINDVELRTRIRFWKRRTANRLHKSQRTTFVLARDSSIVLFPVTIIHKRSGLKRVYFPVREIPLNFSLKFFEVFVGGFGGDRFYLEYWGSGLGKLLTVGGLGKTLEFELVNWIFQLGIWTVVDIFLVCSGYIGPEDGSLYMW